MSDLQGEREQVIHLRRAGFSTKETAEATKRSESWVRKWWHRYRSEGWPSLAGRSQAPQHHGTRTPQSMCRRIVQMRSRLESEAEQGKGLKHIGAAVIRSRLRRQGVSNVPSVPTIERILRCHGITRRPKQAEPEIDYPRLRPDAPHEVCQVDIVPHWLGPKECVACFNAIDVVSHYPCGQAYEQRRSVDAAHFLLHVWQTQGLPLYTQVDNEGCFSGGSTHPHVLGKVVRLALTVGTELVFSPFYHPDSNGTVERFHQEYNRHVWQGTQLKDRQDVQTHTDGFMAQYRQCDYLSALEDETPDAVHHRQPPNWLTSSFDLTAKRLPLVEGKLHFMRAVDADGLVWVLNAPWSVPNVGPDTGVWVTLELTLEGATLSIFDQAPDIDVRCCLATHPFPLKEMVYPHRGQQVACSNERDSHCAQAPAPNQRDDNEPDTLAPWIKFPLHMLVFSVALARFAKHPSSYFR
jgi:hypothetical protein